MEQNTQTPPAQPTPQPQPVATPPVAVAQKSSLFGVLSLVGAGVLLLTLIIIGAVSSSSSSMLPGVFLLFLGVAQYPLPILLFAVPTLVFSIISLSKRERPGRSMAIPVLIFSSLVLLFAIGALVILLSLSSLCSTTTAGCA